MAWLFLVVKYVLRFAVLAVLFVFISNAIFKSKGYNGTESDHFNGKKFFNIGTGKTVPDAEVEKMGSVWKWLLSRKKNRWEQRTVATTKPAERILGGKLVVTFVNHATVLIQTEGFNILTDPMWSKRASPVTFLGPIRYQNPGVTFDDLPPIDIVLLSHNHYDHLDIATLRKLKEVHNPTFYVPLGNARFLRDRGIEGAIDMDWWESKTFTAQGATLSVESVPAQHFSARSFSDRDQTLWGGYVLKTAHGDIYFAGDTGYGPWVDTVKEKYPAGFRLALLPIGAFEPRWFMKEVHVNPEEAWMIKDQVCAKQAMAIHFGTFHLADDAQDQPELVLKQLQEEKKDTTFFALQNGQSAEMK